MMTMTDLDWLVFAAIYLAIAAFFYRRKKSQIYKAMQSDNKTAQELREYLDSLADAS